MGPGPPTSMRPIQADRLFVTGIAAGLALWCGALTILWAVGYDPSGTSLPGTVAALMLAIWAASGLPGRAARGLRRVLTALRLQESLAMELALAGSAPAGRREVKALMRLLAAAAVFAAIAGLLSTAGVYLVSTASDPDGGAGGGFLWGRIAWEAVKLLVEFLVMLPMALGISVTFLVTARIRGGSGRDVYASVFREWLLGVSGGLAAVAAAWWLGADVLGVALVACVGLLAAAAVLLQRAKLAVRPRRSLAPIESVRRPGGQVGIAVASGSLVVALVVQMRLLRDVAGVGLAGQACWAAASLALLMWFLRRADHRSRPPGVAQGLAATMGLLSGIVLQFALAARGLSGGAEAVLCGGLAVAAQGPLAALGAILVSRQRRQFAVRGGRARKYLSSVSAGVGVGLLAYLVVGGMSLAAVAGLGVCIAGLAVPVARGIATAPRRKKRLQWAVLGAVLVGATAAAPVAALRGLPPLKIGVWLTAAATGRGGDDGVLLPSGTVGRGPWRSAAVSAAVRDVLAAHGGRWWLVSACPADVPAVLPEAVTAWRSHPDPTTSPAPGRLGPSQRAWGDFLYEAARDARRFDGLLLAPMPADHPDAWRCYATGVLRRCRKKVHEQGILTLRSQVGPGGIGEALAVARGFREVVGAGWAVVALSESGLDMVLIGPGRAAGGARRPRRRGGAFVVPLDRLCPDGAASSRLGGRGGLLRRRIRPEELRQHLERGGSGG